MTRLPHEFTVPLSALLVTSRPLLGDDGSRAIRRRHERGELRRLGRGVYIEHDRWSALGDRRRHIALMQAAQARHRSQLVFTHDSAAAALGYPAYGFYGDTVHVGTESPRHPTPSLTWHNTALDDDDIVECGPFLVTSPERTLLDIGCSATFTRAVGMMDAAVRTRRDDDPSRFPPRLDLEPLRERAKALGKRPGSRRARMAMNFARDGADSLGESISRAQQFLLGFPEPTLQFAVHDDEGFVGDADQAWPKFQLLGEFDGHTKYTRAVDAKSRSIDEIVFAEKVREDRMRATGPRMARWLWNDAHDGRRLAQILEKAGLPRESKPRTDWAGMKPR